MPTDRPFNFVHINKCGGSSVEIALGIPKRHAKASTLRDEIGADAWAQRFTFALVRNPFSRIVSIYYYRVRSAQGGMVDRHLNVNQWVEKVWGDRDPAYRDEQILFEPASDWVCADGEVIVNMVARLEDIATAWPRITQELGVNVPLRSLNRNLSPDYRDVLIPSARKLLEGAFREDLDRFGYTF
ncbi:MAG: sulfotransferase family 2 domain-containing protein [Paracoccaceae bacterium]